MRLVNWRALVLGAAGLGLAACGDDVTIQDQPISFTANPTAISCQAGGTATAAGLSVTGGSGTPTVAFSAGNGNITVTGSGTSATITCNTAGASSVNFTITSGGQTVTGSIPVTITGAPSPVLAIQITPQSATVAPGGTAQFTASVSLASGAPANTSTAVTFSVVDTTVATVSNAPATAGVVTAKATAAGRSTVVRATSVANPNLVASATLTVGPASSLVSSLTVSPSTTVLVTGQTQQITSNVTLAAGAPAGTSTGVTYTSSDTSIARVSSTGVITAGSRAGTATITVASAAAPTVTQTVAVTVSQLAPVTLTIQSLTTTTAAGQTINVDQANVNGPIFLTLNLETGSFRPDSLIATLGGQRVVCQRFTAQLAEAFRAASQGTSADVQPVVCQLNTAAFDTTTGVAQVLNGTQTLNATVFFRPVGGGASTTQTAQIGLPLTLTNQSGFFVNVTNTPSAAQVANGGPASGQTTGPQGVLWRAGDVRVQVVPVFFTQAGGTPTGTQTVTVALADVNSPAGFATQTVNFNAGTPAVATFTGTTAAYTAFPTSNTVTGYSSPNAGGVSTAGGAIAAGTPQGTQIIVNGNTNTTFLTSAGRVSAGSTIYIDNAAPDQRQQFVSNNFLLAGGPSGFVNGSFVFADSVQQGVQVGGAASTALNDNNGVDRVARAFFFDSVSAGRTPAQITSSAGRQVTSGNQIAQNTSQTFYNAAVKLTDALGNATSTQVTALAGGAAFTFGVITATPTVAITTAGTTIGANGRIGAASASPATIAFSATSTAGAAFPANFIVGTLQVTNQNGTFCAVPGDVVGGALVGPVTSATTSPPCPTLAFNTVSINTAAAPAGVYTLSFQSRDVAGNLSATSTRTFAIDIIAPQVNNAVVTSPPLTGGATETFGASATDNLNLVDQHVVVHYPTAGAELNFRYLSGTPISTAFSTVFTRTATLSAAIDFFYRAIANQTSAGGVFTAVNNGAFSTTDGAALGVSDPGANWTNAAVGAYTLDNTPGQTTAPNFFGGTAAQAPTSVSVRYVPSTSTTAATLPPGTLASATSGTPTSFTLQVIQNGVANTPFINQFSRIDLYIQGTIPGALPAPFATNVGYSRIGSFGGASVSTSTTSSTITNSITVTPGSGGIPAFPGNTPVNVNLLVVASNANGYAVSFVIPQFTINP